MLEHVQVQIADQTVFFQLRQKITYWNHAFFRIDPAYQCFRFRDLPCAQIDFRLEIKFKVFMFQRWLEILLHVVISQIRIIVSQTVYFHV